MRKRPLCMFVFWGRICCRAAPPALPIQQLIRSSSGSSCRELHGECRYTFWYRCDLGDKGKVQKHNYSDSIKKIASFQSVRACGGAQSRVAAQRGRRRLSSLSDRIDHAFHRSKGSGQYTIT